MKKILLTISTVIASFMGVTAQTPDLGFEIWDPVPPGAIDDPRGWASFNALIIGGMPQTVFQETTAPYAGNISAKIVTDTVPSGIHVPNPFRGGLDADTIGVVGVGKLQTTAPFVFFGYPYTLRSAKLTFACKYTPAGVDTAFVLVFLTKWNAANNHRDTIALGVYKAWDTTTTYANQSITLTYNTSLGTMIPDTAQIDVFSSVYSHDGAKRGSTFYIDAVNWVGIVSTNDIDGEVNHVSVYPNPASNNITLTCSVDANYVEVADLMGRVIGSYKMNNNKVEIETHTYAKGMYIYRVMNDKKAILNKGKFEISK